MLSLIPLLPFVLLVAGRPDPIVSAPPSVNTDNPSASDPTSPPASIAFPSRPPNPYPSGISDQPDICNGLSPSKDCLQALGTPGGDIQFDKDSGCTNDQKSILETAVWDANTLAFYSSTFPNAPPGAKGLANAIYWMGPNYASQQARISGNLDRVYKFKTSDTSSSTKITLSCTDTKHYCGQRINGKAVGGYAWTYNGWFGYYHYITLCPSYFTLDSLDTKLSQVEKELAGGQTKMATDSDWLRNTGQFFLHEMMHTRIADGGVEPHIEDRKLGEDNEVMAYGPTFVHKLAERKFDQGGGADSASINADSYAVMANAAWWWDTTGYFPAAVGKPPTISDVDGNNATELIFPDIILGNITDPSTADFDSLYTAAFAQYDDNAAAYYSEDDPDFDTTSTSTTVAPSAAPTPTAAPATDICGDWYKFILDHFEIYGKNFDAAKLGQDGSGLKSTLANCGAITAWEFKTLTDDPNGYQWYAQGNSIIGTKSCVGNKLKSLGGNADGCSGAG